MSSVEQALDYWHHRHKTEPEPLKSFAREHIAHLLQFLPDDAERFVWEQMHKLSEAALPGKETK